MKLMEALADEATQLFQKPMRLEFENLAVKFIIMNKKRYASILTSGKTIRGHMTVQQDRYIDVFDASRFCVKHYHGCH